jgi:hypothetical protein
MGRSSRCRPDDRTELHRRLVEVLEEFKSRTAYDADDSDDAGGDWWSVFFAMHRDTRGAPG